MLLSGATGGIGGAIARELHARGAELVLTGRRRDVLESLRAELGARTIVADLALRAEVERLLDEVGEVDVLVANAALPATGLLIELGPDEIDRMLDVNLRAPIRLARGLATGMIERGDGHMVFVSSLAGKVASAASSMYSSTKFGLRGFALGVREDLRPYGVGVSLVVPGFVRDAGMYADSGVQLPRGVGTSSPEEVAAGVLRAIEHDRAEVEVAPLGLRLGTALGSLAPELASRFIRRFGGERIAAEFAARQAPKR